MRPKSCIVNGPLALVLRVMRVFALAPLVFARERGGNRIRLSKPYALIGNICAFILDILHAYSLWINFTLSTDLAIPNTALPLALFLWLSDVLLVTISCGIGWYFSATKMNDVIEQVVLMEKATLKRNNKKRMNDNKIIICLVASRICIGIFHFLYHITYVRNATQKSLIFDFLSSRLKYLVVCLMQVHVFAMYRIFLSKLGLLREEVQDMADLLEFDYVESSPSFTQSANMRLQKVGETFEYLRDIFTNMNKCYEYPIFFIFISIVYRFIKSALDLVMYNEGGLRAIALHIVLVMHQMFSLVVTVEPFRGIDLEMQAMKLQVARIATTAYVNRSIPPPLDMLYRELTTTDLSFSPLGVFTLRRSLLTKTLGAAISYLVIVLQLKED